MGSAKLRFDGRSRGWPKCGVDTDWCGAAGGRTVRIHVTREHRNLGSYAAPDKHHPKLITRRCHALKLRYPLLPQPAAGKNKAPGPGGGRWRGSRARRGGERGTERGFPKICETFRDVRSSLKQCWGARGRLNGRSRGKGRRRGIGGDAFIALPGRQRNGRRSSVAADAG